MLFEKNKLFDVLILQLTLCSLFILYLFFSDRNVNEESQTNVPVPCDAESSISESPISDTTTADSTEHACSTDTVSRSHSSRCSSSLPPTQQKRSSSEPPSQQKPRKLRKDGQPCKNPLSLEDYKAYADVLPSARSINKQKLLLATQCELDAATALLDIRHGIKSTLHYDTTTRSGIDGDWVSLILAFSDERRYRFRPMFMAYEDRANIVRYLVESYERLAVICSESKERVVTAAELWEKTNSLMTDAVSKNLTVGSLVGEQLQSQHVPHHLLCKSHTVEGLDRSNLAVLAEIERTIKLREKMEAVTPGIKSFTQGGSSIVECGMKSILNLISHAKSASPTNISHLFDVICEREGATKHFSLYQERRFAKLGYMGGSILDSIPLLEMLLNECSTENLHTESVRMFINCEFFSTSLAVLSYFSYHVSFPLLYCVEISSQHDLCQILPQLHIALLAGKTDTLAAFTIPRHQYCVKPLTSELELLLHKRLCTAAAGVIELQCAGEYFSDRIVENPRATRLCDMSEVELEGLPTNNLDTERDFSVFDRISRIAKLANRIFTGEDIKNNMTLLGEVPELVSDQAKRVIPKLAERLVNWTKEQLQLQVLKDEEKLQKARNTYNFQNRVLNTCKSWGGPCTSVGELETALARTDNPQQCVTQELTYYKLTHHSEF